MSQNDIIAERLTLLREKKGVNQQDVADMLHVKRTTVANYEAGKRSPDYDTLVKLADYYGVSCDYIIRGVRSEFSEINSTLGLNDEAVDFLSYMVSFWRTQSTSSKALNIMNSFISSGNFSNLIAIMTDYHDELIHTTNAIESAITTLNDQSVDTDNTELRDVLPLSEFDRELKLYLYEMQELSKGFIQQYANKELADFSNAAQLLNDINRSNNEHNIRIIAVEKLQRKAGESHGDDQEEE